MHRLILTVLLLTPVSALACGNFPPDVELIHLQIFGIAFSITLCVFVVWFKRFLENKKYPNSSNIQSIQKSLIGCILVSILLVILLPNLMKLFIFLVVQILGLNNSGGIVTESGMIVYPGC